jgi:D-sedoheptulose 7-phosphate isomerase
MSNRSKTLDEVMQTYFSRRAAPKPADYEESYWGTIVDPDGNERERLQERDQSLDDVRQELAFLSSLSPGRILDVGCGPGYLLSALPEGWDRHGVELSRFAADHASKSGTIYVGTLEEAAYSDEHFDVVIMHHVIEHMVEPIESILEVRRILKRGGILVLGTPDFDGGCARRFGDKYRLLRDPTHISLFTNESMHRFLRDHGFIIDRVEYPFFDGRFFTRENLLRLFDTSKVSPPFYGNFMTFYCHKPDRGPVHESMMDLSRLMVTVAESLESHIEEAGKLIADCLQAGGKVLACGNGGSAADAQHFVAELIGRMSHERGALPAISLTTDPSVVTALGNDYGFDRIFSRQIEGLGKEGDVLLVVSTGGRSPNVLRALEAARLRGMHTIAMVGEGGDRSLSECDVRIGVPSSNTQRIQEAHSAVLHAICLCVDQHVAARGDRT